jgi:putative peptidoglycan lipid II flippase
MSENQNIAKSVGKISFATFLSRIFGLIRDMLRAYYFGTSIAADAFTVAFRIPNLFRELLGEGTMSAAFVPVYTEYLTKKSKKDAMQLALAMGSLLIIILSLLTILGITFAPQFVMVMAKGFMRIPEKFQLTVSLTRILFPYIFFISLAAFVMGILNSHKQFFIPALTPVALNLCMIVGMVGFARYLGKTPEQQVYALAWAALIGGIAQLIIQLPSLYKKGFRFSLNFDWKHSGVVKIVKLIVPRLFGMAVREINILVDTFLAALLVTGSVAALEYGSRLMMLPLGVFGVAIGTAVLPTLSAQASNGDYDQLKNTLSFAIRLIFLILLPASIGLIILRRPIIQLLLQRGEFGLEKALPMTSQALLFYSVGLVPFGLIKGVVPVFYAMQDTKTPVKISAIALVVNVTLNLILMQYLGLGGLALASSISAAVNVSLLLFVLRKKIGMIGGRYILKTFFKILISSILMGITCWLAVIFLEDIWQSNSILFRLISVFVPMILGFIIFVISCWILKLSELYQLFEIVKRKFVN